MPEIVQVINRGSETWAAIMLAVTVQSALLLGLAMLVAILLHRSSPALRYWLWQIAAIKLLIMPLWT